jgi:aryl-alcohol dehydrogenase-like predicted oxidoreductase
MLNRALDDDCWDVAMVGFNVINQSATPLLRRMRNRGIGTVCAFAVRGALSSRERARKLVLELVAAGQVDAREIDEAAPLDFLIEGGGGESLPDAAYRFCRHAEGVDTVLTGTGDAQHLLDNVASIAAGPLHAEAVERARRIFARVDSVSAE